MEQVKDNVVDIRDQKIKELELSLINEKIARCMAELGQLEAIAGVVNLRQPMLQQELTLLKAQKEHLNAPPSN